MSLVETDWLFNNLNKVKIIDCSWHMPQTKRNGFEEYKKNHIPGAIFFDLDENSKKNIIIDIENDFSEGLKGIKLLPIEAKFGVFMAYRYYSQLLKKLKKTPALEIKNTRIRVPNYKKIELLTRSFVKYHLNLL